MGNRTYWIGCLLWVNATGCTIVDETGSTQDGSVATPSDADAASTPQPDVATESSSDAAVVTIDGDAGSTGSDGDASPVVDEGNVGDAVFDAAPDATPTGPGGDGGLVLGGDGGGADGAFQLKNAAATNLLSSSDVRPVCTTLDGVLPASHVMICIEAPGGNQPCRTVMVIFNGAPTSARVYTSVAKASPDDGESVVQYQEASDCTSATTNTWAAMQTGGDFTIDVFGDTGFDFTLHDVPLAPAAPALGVTNQNAMGTFILAGSGVSSFPFASAPRGP